MKFDIGKSDLVSMFLLPTSIINNFDPHDNPFRLRGGKNFTFTLYIFEEKYSFKNTLLNVLPYEQAS